MRNNYTELAEQRRDAQGVKMCMDAASALTALVEKVKELEANLKNYRDNHCGEGGCAAEKDRDIVIENNARLRAELEQMKRDLLNVCEHPGEINRKLIALKWRGSQEEK